MAWLKIPPPQPPITAELCGGWLSFLDQCKCEVQITAFEMESGISNKFLMHFLPIFGGKGN